MEEVLFTFLGLTGKCQDCGFPSERGWSYASKDWQVAGWGWFQAARHSLHRTVEGTFQLFGASAATPGRQ